MSCAVVITVVLPVFLLPAAVISFVFFCIGRLYLRNALAARKEVAAARSPLFSTLGDSTSGVTTIRAYGRSGAFAARYKRQTDNYNRVSEASHFLPNTMLICRLPCRCNSAKRGSTDGLSCELT